MLCWSNRMEAKSIQQEIKISNLILFLIKTQHQKKSLIKLPRICVIMFLRAIMAPFLPMELLGLEKLILWLVISKNLAWCFIRSTNYSFKLNRLKSKFNKILMKVRFKMKYVFRLYKFLFWKFIMNKLEI